MVLKLPSVVASASHGKRGRMQSAALAFPTSAHQQQRGSVRRGPSTASCISASHEAVQWPSLKNEDLACVSSVVK
eukprot:2861632-Amphidinium_carterae.3